MEKSVRKLPETITKRSSKLVIKQETKLPFRLRKAEKAYDKAEKAYWKAREACWEAEKAYWKAWTECEKAWKAYKHGIEKRDG